MTSSPMAPAQPSGLDLRALLGWVVVGALVSFGIAGMLTIGLFILPVAVVAAVLLDRLGARHPAPGLLIGAGLVLLWVSWNLRIVSDPVCTGTASGDATSGAVITDACHHVEMPWMWLIPAVGALLAGIALLARQLRAGHPHTASTTVAD